MKQFIRLILISLCGWLGVVKSIQQPHTACRTLYSIHYDKLEIKCNTDELLYTYQLNLNYLANDPRLIADNSSECQESPASACFLSIPAEYTFYRTISKICNENHICTLQNRDFEFYVTKFRDMSICSDMVDIYKIRIGIFYECFPSKEQVYVGLNLTETRDGSLYLTSYEGRRCLIRGSIESARILEQVNMRFNVSDSNSRFCTEIITNGSFNYNEDLSCLRDVKEFILDIQTTHAVRGKLWIEFKGSSLQLDCRSNIQFPSVVRVDQDSKQNGGSTLLPIIIGLVAGLLLLLALILVLLKRRHALTIKAEAKHRTLHATTTLEGDQDCTYYNNDVDKPRNDANDVQGTSSFDESFYNKVDTDCNYAQINTKKNTSEYGRNNEEHNVKNEIVGNKKSRDESRDTNNVTPRSSKTAETKPNTIIGEVTGDVYAAVCKTDGLKSMRITGPKGDIYTTVSISSNVE